VLKALIKKNGSVTLEELRAAIENEQLVVYYQPKVFALENAARRNAMPNPISENMLPLLLDTESDGTWEVSGLEALVRWEHPKLGLLPPDKFIYLAEESGLIKPLSEFVLRKAIEQAQRWKSAGFDMKVAVNLSPHLLDDLELPDRISDIMADCDVEGQRLLLEITESGAMADAAATMEILTRFRLQGIELSLDDFGTGYSSLVQLYQLPFSELKIDKSFVLEFDQHQEAKIIIRTIMELAHNLGMTVCAEGVETATSLKYLREIGCEKAQGYLLSRPVPEAKLLKILRTSLQEAEGTGEDITNAKA